MWYSFDVDVVVGRVVGVFGGIDIFVNNVGGFVDWCLLNFMDDVYWYYVLDFNLLLVFYMMCVVLLLLFWGGWIVMVGV